MTAVLDHLFQKPGIERVVVEPDARNTKIHALNERLGFQPAAVVDLPDKQALLSFCTRADFHAARDIIEHDLQGATV
ncbi:GNAT family N-acetyltransferase [Arthrobacter sp. SA17]